VNTEDVTVVRIFITEGKHQLQDLMSLLHDEHKVSGVTVLRGITGFGRSGRLHSSSLLDMSLDLPLVLEFFDQPEKVKAVLEDLGERVQPGHLIFWPAKVNTGQ